VVIAAYLVITFTYHQLMHPF